MNKIAKFDALHMQKYEYLDVWDKIGACRMSEKQSYDLFENRSRSNDLCLKKTGLKRDPKFYVVPFGETKQHFPNDPC